MSADPVPPPSLEEKSRTARVHRTLLVSSWVFLAITSVWVVFVGRNFLIPLVIAIFGAFLIETVTRLWMQIPFGKRHMPRWFALSLSALAMGFLLYNVGDIIATNATKVAHDAQTYQNNLNQVHDRLVAEAAKLGLEEPDAIDEWFNSFDFESLISSFVSSLAVLFGDSALVILYLFFILMERKFFDPKLKALFPDPKRRKKASEVIQAIDHDIRVYVGVKTFVSLLTAVGGFLIMQFVGLNYPAFWALLLFIFNFIPNIGSLVATLLPAVLALMQFPENPLQQFFIVGGGIWAVQLFVANIVEPPLMGKTLNMSALVVILSLVFWGMLWGIAGMFLCIPLTVVAMIVCSYFPSTRGIATLLSRDGMVRGNDAGEETSPYS